MWGWYAKSRWEAGVDAYERRYSGWWSGSGGGGGDDDARDGVVSFSEGRCLPAAEVECVVVGCGLVGGESLYKL